MEWDACCWSLSARGTESRSSVGQSTTLIMWGSAVQVRPGLRHGGLAQLARAPALQAGGRRFESGNLHVGAACCGRLSAAGPGMGPEVL